MESTVSMENTESMTNTKATKEKSRREKKQPKWKWLIVISGDCFLENERTVEGKKRDRSQNPTKSGYAGSTGCNDFSRTK